MDRRRSLLASAAGLFGALVGGAVQGQTPQKHRVVFDLTAEGAERWDGVLRNIENVRKAFGAENVEVQLVVHGKAYPLLQQTNIEMQGRLQALSEGGVRLSLCQNTMRRFNVAKESLFPFVGTVDAAVAELVRRQEAGWAYIKAGA